MQVGFKDKKKQFLETPGTPAPIWPFFSAGWYVSAERLQSGCTLSDQLFVCSVLV